MMKKLFMSFATVCLLIHPPANAQRIVEVGEAFDPAAEGLTLAPGRAGSGCGDAYEIYLDSNGEEAVWRQISTEPTVNGVSISDLSPQDLTRNDFHFQANGQRYQSDGREDTSTFLKGYAEAQLQITRATKAQALNHYSSWYTARERESRLENVGRDILKGLIKTAFKTGMKYLLPGSEEVVSVISDISSNVYTPVIDEAFRPGGTPQDAIAALKQRFENNGVNSLARLNTLVTTTGSSVSERRRREIWERIVFVHITDGICEVVDSSYSDPSNSVGYTVQVEMERLGLPANLNNRKQARLLRGTLNSLIKETLRSEVETMICAENRVFCGWEGGYRRYLAPRYRNRINSCLERNTTAHVNQILGGPSQEADRTIACVEAVIESL